MLHSSENCVGGNVDFILGADKQNIPLAHFIKDPKRSLAPMKKVALPVAWFMS
jgi:hypothetical protein